jgi:chromosome segregation ATPase
MKTIEELEAELETVTRERDMSLAAWESAGMTGRTAQSAMLELARQLEEARAEVAILTTALDERDAEAERSLEQYDSLVRERDEARAESAKWKAGFEEFRSRNTDLMMHLFEAQEKVRAVNIEPMLHLNAQLRSKTLGLGAEVDRLMHQLADATNESTHFQVMCKRETEEVERLARQVELLTDERDELLVRAAEQGAELRATREAYNGAQAELTRERIGIRPVDEVRSDAYRRGAEAMREACAYRLVLYKDTVRAEMIRALPIPGEP